MDRDGMDAHRHFFLRFIGRRAACNLCTTKSSIAHDIEPFMLMNWHLKTVCLTMTSRTCKACFFDADICVMVPTIHIYIQESELFQSVEAGGHSGVHLADLIWNTSSSLSLDCGLAV